MRLVTAAWHAAVRYAPSARRLPGGCHSVGGRVRRSRSRLDHALHLCARPIRCLGSARVVDATLPPVHSVRSFHGPAMPSEGSAVRLPLWPPRQCGLEVRSSRPSAGHRWSARSTGGRRMLEFHHFKRTTRDTRRVFLGARVSRWPY